MAELEEIYSRKHYKLPIDWTCFICGKHGRVIGRLIGEDPDPKSQLSWESIIQKYCGRCGTIERPSRECSYCQSIYGFEASGCSKCDAQISAMIDMEEQHNDLLDTLKSMKRKKEPTTNIETSIDNLFTSLIELKAKACRVCDRFWMITLQDFTCKKCLDKVCG